MDLFEELSPLQGSVATDCTCACSHCQSITDNRERMYNTQKPLLPKCPHHVSLVDFKSRAMPRRWKYEWEKQKALPGNSSSLLRLYKCKQAEPQQGLAEPQWENRYWKKTRWFPSNQTAGPAHSCGSIFSSMPSRSSASALPKEDTLKNGEQLTVNREQWMLKAKSVNIGQCFPQDSQHSDLSNADSVRCSTRDIWRS